MVLDIIILIILIGTMVTGFRRGFMYTFTRTLGWIAAMIAGFVATPHVKTYLMENTAIYHEIFDRISSKLTTSDAAASASADSLPQIATGGIADFLDQAGQVVATQLTDLFLSILCFFIVFLAVRLVLSLITRIFSKKDNSGFAGFFDGVLGLIAGGMKGSILVFAFLALLFPAVNLISPESTDAVLQSLDDSVFARTLYDNNFILIIADYFFN